MCPYIGAVCRYIDWDITDDSNASLVRIGLQCFPLTVEFILHPYIEVHFMAIFFLIELYKFIVTVIKVKRPEGEPALDEEEIKRRAIEEYLAAQKEKEEAAKASEAEASAASLADKAKQAAEGGNAPKDAESAPKDDKPEEK